MQKHISFGAEWCNFQPRSTFHFEMKGPAKMISNLTIYKLDTETEGSTRFRNPRARGCSVPSAARALLRARGFLKRVDPVGRGV